jgi:hypothetical protein
LAEASAGAAAAGGLTEAGGRDDGSGAFAIDADERGAADAGAVLGSGLMMLTAGVEAAVGNSALVGLPVGIDGARAATGAGAAAGAFHEAE